MNIPHHTLSFAQAIKYSDNFCNHMRTEITVSILHALNEKVLEMLDIIPVFDNHSNSIATIEIFNTAGL